MATDRVRVSHRPSDAIFLDDMLLRLKFWSAEVRVGEGCLEWAGTIQPIGATLQELLHQLDRELQLFDTLSRSNGDTEGTLH